MVLPVRKAILEMTIPAIVPQSNIDFLLPEGTGSSIRSYNNRVRKRLHISRKGNQSRYIYLPVSIEKVILPNHYRMIPGSRRYPPIIVATTLAASSKHRHHPLLVHPNHNLRNG